MVGRITREQGASYAASDSLHPAVHGRQQAHEQAHGERIADFAGVFLNPTKDFLDMGLAPQDCVFLV